MTLSSLSFIQGLSLGLEFVDAIPEEDIENSIVLDFFLFRLVFTLK